MPQCCAQTVELRQLATACRAGIIAVHRGSGTGKPVFRDSKVGPLDNFLPCLRS